MGSRLFDEKFGAERLREIPRGPGVYLFRDAEGRVLYAGKAKDLRRRLACYRNASRRKAHRKMRALVREATSLEVQPHESEMQALLSENELIRTLRPRFNVDGAFTFLYPTLGVGSDGGRLLLAFTSTPEEWGSLAMRWHGCFRSRMRARAAFDALVALFGRIGHREPMSRLPDVPLRRGVRLEAFRRLSPELAAAASAFLAGESTDLLTMLFERLLESASARRDAAEVEEQLRTLAGFARKDVAALRRALQKTGRSGWVPGEERDALFIAARHSRRHARADASSASRRSGAGRALLASAKHATSPPRVRAHAEIDDGIERCAAGRPRSARVVSSAGRQRTER
ncbi:MAG TPA: GIY-YIG nuclease family protein [Myxococcota bacterium]|nr:GIY-YIG nuclease family protein [Myxococcota bacterium]